MVPNLEHILRTVQDVHRVCWRLFAVLERRGGGLDTRTQRTDFDTPRACALKGTSRGGTGWSGGGGGECLCKGQTSEVYVVDRDCRDELIARFVP